MPDYKKLYLELFRATERATRLLIAAQRECEEGISPRPNRSCGCFPRRGRTAKRDAEAEKRAGA